MNATTHIQLMPTNGIAARPFGTPRMLGRALGAALLLLLAAAAVLPVDVQLAHALQGNWIGGDLRRIILLAEVYGHGSGVAMILISIAVLHPTARRRVLRLALAVFGAGLAANVVKLCVARTRPHGLAETAQVADSFVGLFPLWLGTTEPYTHALQSFPSAHTATAVGLALGMTRLYPHGRWLFLTFASLATLQRMVVGAHYPSDCLCGAAVGLVVAALVMDSRVGGAWLRRFEERGGASEETLPVRQAA